MDLVVVCDGPGTPLERHVRLEEAIGVEERILPVDIIALTSETFEKRLAEGNSFLTMVIETGKVIYET